MFVACWDNRFICFLILLVYFLALVIYAKRKIHRQQSGFFIFVFFRFFKPTTNVTKISIIIVIATCVGPKDANLHQSRLCTATLLHAENRDVIIVSANEIQSCSGE